MKADDDHGKIDKFCVTIREKVTDQHKIIEGIEPYIGTSQSFINLENLLLKPDTHFIPEDILPLLWTFYFTNNLEQYPHNTNISNVRLIEHLEEEKTTEIQFNTNSIGHGSLVIKINLEGRECDLRLHNDQQGNFAFQVDPRSSYFDPKFYQKMDVVDKVQFCMQQILDALELDWNQNISKLCSQTDIMKLIILFACKMPINPEDYRGTIVELDGVKYDPIPKVQPGDTSSAPLDPNSSSQPGCDVYHAPEPDDSSSPQEGSPQVVDPSANPSRRDQQQAPASDRGSSQPNADHSSKSGRADISNTSTSPTSPASSRWLGVGIFLGILALLTIFIGLVVAGISQIQKHQLASSKQHNRKPRFEPYSQ